MAEEVSINIKATGLDGMIDALRDVGQPPTYKTTGKLEATLDKVFIETQARVHVISGRLKLSGYPATNLKKKTWTGSVNYGGIKGTPAYYAIYELNRGGTRPDGTPHDFFSGLDAFDGDFEDAIDSHFKGLA